MADYIGNFGSNNKGSTSEIAQCYDCDWSSEDRNARKRAADHSGRTGHFTTAEVVRAYHYGKRAHTSVNGSEGDG